MATYQPMVAQLNQAVERLRNSGQNTEADEILQITAQYEILEDQVDQQCKKTRQDVNLRQQFADQKSQLEALATATEDEVNEVSQPGLSLPVKIDKLKVSTYILIILSSIS